MWSAWLVMPRAHTTSAPVEYGITAGSDKMIPPSELQSLQLPPGLSCHL